MLHGVNHRDERKTQKQIPCCKSKVTENLLLFHSGRLYMTIPPDHAIMNETIDANRWHPLEEANGNCW